MPVVTHDLSLDLFIALNRASYWVNALAERDIARYGLTWTEFGVLELLHHKGSQPLREIGGRVLMSSGNTTYVVDKLERKGYVTRRACTKDRRLIYADLTESGRVFIEEVFPKHAEIIHLAVEGLDEREKQAVSSLLKKLGSFAQQGYK